MKTNVSIASACLLVAGLSLITGGCANPTAESSVPPLIPRSLILEESERGNPVLSPDGKRIAYSAQVDAVQNIWVKTVGQDDDRAVTGEKENGIDFCFWQADSRHVLYFKDQAGNEDTHLFQIDVQTGQTKDLTPVKGARARTLIMDAARPDELLIHLNARDRRFFDVHRLDLRTGALRLDTKNPGDVSQFYADPRLRVRAALAVRPDNSVEIRVRDDESSPWRKLIAWGADEMNSDRTGIAGFTADGAALFIVTSLEANAERLIEVNLKTGERKAVCEDPQFDVAAVMINPVRHTLEAAGVDKERMAWTFFDEDVRTDFEALGKVRDGEIWIRDRDREDRTWLVKFAAADSPTTYYLYDRAARKASFLFSEDPKLESVRLSPKTPVQFPASDGLTIYGYLTLPPGGSSHNLPLVVQVHGGPWARVRWDLEFPVQLLANRGYAVLEVNFRGSTGYGKAYQNAGDLEWGGAVIQDLVDGKNWAAARGVADPKRVAIMGGSFGGYATLAALAFRPGEFACGISMNGISDANLLMETMPSYWTVARAQFETRMGKEPEFLKRISPLHKAEQVVSPLLLIHNANDVRVVKGHSDRMAAALREHGKDVIYLLFQAAGHVGGGNSNSFWTRWAAIEAFLAKHLGGRAEPPGPTERWESLLK